MERNLFELAELQLLREGKEPTEAGILAYAVKIRKWLDRHKKSSEVILAGGKVYQYNKRLVIAK